MKILYVFPHPDDESFGPAGVIHQQRLNGHYVYLLTLTKGGATKERHKYGHTVSQMGEVRYKEMLEMKKTLDLTQMEVWDFPDGKLKNTDPRKLEEKIKAYVQTIEPDIIVTYPIHGISGFHDHLATHAVVKRVYLDLKEQPGSSLKRLAFFTIPDNGESVFKDGGFRLKHSDPEDIDCEITLNDDNIDMFKRCLACYETYRDKIEQSGVVKKIGKKVYFEFFGESIRPMVQDITDRI